MVSLDVTKKRHIYRTLYRLNVSFAAIVAHCRTLQEAGVVKRKYARLYQAFAQELQAQINEELLETMQAIEFDDCARFGRVRDARDKELRDPADVLLAAEDYKRRLARKRRTRRRKARTKETSRNQRETYHGDTEARRKTTSSR